MIVKIQLTESSQIIEHKDVINSYTKGPLFCVYCGDLVYKYPVANIWRVIEDFGPKHTTKPVKPTSVAEQWELARADRLRDK